MNREFIYIHQLNFLSGLHPHLLTANQTPSVTITLYRQAAVVNF